MASTTTNMGLTKPAASEAYDVGVTNGNWDKIDERAIGAVYGAGQTYFSGETLSKCSGSIGAHFAYHVSGKLLIIEGRLTINNFVRTGANPGIALDLPNGLKAKKSAVMDCGINGYYDGNDVVFRLGENTRVQTNAGSSVVNIYTTETYTNMGDSTPKTRAIFQVFPLVIEVQ